MNHIDVEQDGVDPQRKKGGAISKRSREGDLGGEDMSLWLPCSAASPRGFQGVHR